MSTCPDCTPFTPTPEGLGTTHLRELDLALVQSTRLSGLVASGEEAISSTHKDHIWPWQWLQCAAGHLIAHLVAQRAAVGVHLAKAGWIRVGQLWACSMPTVGPVIPLLPHSEDLVLTMSGMEPGTGQQRWVGSRLCL